MIERGCLGLALASIARPGRAIAAVSLLTLAALPGLFRLELRVDGHDLVPAGDPAVLADQEVRERFGLRDPIIVVVATEHPDGIYNPATLRRVEALTATFRALDAIDPEHVLSLATEHRDRVWPGTLDFRAYLEPFPEEPWQLAELQGDVEAAAILQGTLVAVDGSATAILIGVPPRGGDRTALYRRIEAAAERHRSDGDRILVVGAPVAEALLGVHILEDLARLLPLALAIIALVLGIACRRLWGVALGLAEVGACLVFTFGLMGWLGVPISLTTAVLPVILTTVGLADEIHIFWHHQDRLHRHAGLLTGAPAAGAQAAAETLRQMTRPVVVTSLTTTLGFATFLTSPIHPVRAFGGFAAVGILFCMLFSLTAIPAALALLPAGRVARPRRQPGAFWRHLAAAIARRPRTVLAAVGLLTLGLGLGATRLHVQDSWLDGFAPSSPLRRATDQVNRAFFGTHLLYAQLAFAPTDLDLAAHHIPVDDRGPLLDHRRLRAAGEFEAFLAERPEVGGVLGPAAQLETVLYLWQGRTGDRRLPDTPGLIWTSLKYFDKGRGEHRRREVIADDRRHAVVTIFLEDANYRETANLMAAIRAWERQHLAPLGIAVSFAGDVAVSQAMIPAIVTTQVRSLALALLGAWLCVALLERSPRAGLLAVAPAACAVLWAFGALGWLGIPLGVATSMFCAVTLGIGVDHAVHLIDRFRRARTRADPDPLRAALETAGPAIAADALAVGLGFALLGISQVPANGRLGWLVALALAAGALLTLAGLGALLHLLFATTPRTPAQGGAPPASSPPG